MESGFRFARGTHLLLCRKCHSVGLPRNDAQTYTSAASKQFALLKQMKFSSLLLALLGATLTSHAALTAGDIAIVGFQASGTGSDSISFATLNNLAPGQVIYFTDNGYSTGSGYRGVTSTDNDGNENLMKFTAGPSGLAAGQVVSSKGATFAGNWTLTGPIATTVPVSSGAYAQLSLNNGGEQLTVFTSSNLQPALTGTTALYNFDNTGVYEAATTSITGVLAPGLVQGTTAFLTNNSANFANFNFSLFTGSADKATWLSRMGNSANWTFSSATTDTANGTFAVVPEPAAALLGSLGLLALLRRRR